MPRLRWNTSGALVVTLVLASVLAGVAWADQNSDAKARYESGNAHYNLNELPEALADFKEAYRLRRDPVFLYNIAQCHRRLNAFADAATFYRSYLREASDAPNRAEVERRIDEMDKAAADKTAADEARAAAQREADQKAQEMAAERAAAQRQTNVVVTEAPPSPPKPLYKKGWFWGAVVGGAAVVAVAVTLGVVLGVEKNPKPSLGTAEVH